jgi:hypothetical protein
MNHVAFFGGNALRVDGGSSLADHVDECPNLVQKQYIYVNGVKKIDINPLKEIKAQDELMLDNRDDDDRI